MDQMLKVELDEHLDYEYGKKPLSLNKEMVQVKKQLNHHIKISFSQLS